MIEILGIPKVSSQLLRLGKFRNRVNTKLAQQNGNYVSMARRIVRQVVYSTPENPLYPRSGNTEASVNARVVGGNRIDSQINVFLDPKKANRGFGYNYFGGIKPKGISSYYSLTSQGGFAFYPSYVRRGIFFKQVSTERDFMTGWAEEVGPKFRRDVAGSIR